MTFIMNLVEEEPSRGQPPRPVIASSGMENVNSYDGSVNSETYTYFKIKKTFKGLNDKNKSCSTQNHRLIPTWCFMHPTKESLSPSTKNGITDPSLINLSPLNS